MSRSYKRNPIVTGKIRAFKAKRAANKKVRKAKELSSGKFYTRVYEKDNIKDFTSRYTLESFLKDWETNPELQERFASQEEVITFWKLNYLGK